jgi:argininosuccinate lyase
MADRAGLGYAQATDLADVIMLSKGLPYERAHRVVGQLVADAVEAGVPAEEITVEMVDGAAWAAVGYPLELSRAVLAEALDPRAIVETRTGLGGAAREPMAAMIDECREAVAGLESWRQEKEARLLQAEEGLLALAGSMAAPSRRPGRSEAELSWQGASEKARFYPARVLDKSCRV